MGLGTGSGSVTISEPGFKAYELQLQRGTEGRGTRRKTSRCWKVDSLQSKDGGKGVVRSQAMSGNGDRQAGRRCWWLGSFGSMYFTYSGFHDK